nr:hypothetical protein [Desulfobacterales bacterium]
MITFFKRRSNTKKKIQAVIRHGIDFDAKDYETIAKDFGIPVEAARHLVNLLKRCFHKDGHFLRKSFEANIPEFARYEKKVFEFLWHYLKETIRRSDRVAFLNSLQLLIEHVDQRKKALRTLLEDFLDDRSKVNFSDRNALMLANLLIRKYNKELNNDVEITPEEVLLVVEGLDRDVLNTGREFIETNQEDFFEKIRTIHNQLREVLNSDETSTQRMPLRYLFTLEREIYIFLSLVGGGTALSVIRSAVKEYGDSESEIYFLKKSMDHLQTLLQILRVVVRGLGRIGGRKELPLLESVKKHQEWLLGLGEGSSHKELVMRIIGWVDTSMEKISIREKRNVS